MRLCWLGSPNARHEAECNQPPRQYCFTTWRARFRRTHQSRFEPLSRELESVHQEPLELGAEMGNGEESPLFTWLRTSGCGWYGAPVQAVEQKLKRVGIHTVADLEQAVKHPCKLNSKLQAQREAPFNEDTLKELNMLFEEARQTRDWQEKVNDRCKSDVLTGVHLMASPCRRRHELLVVPSCKAHSEAPDVSIEDDCVEVDVQDLESFITCNAPLDPNETYVTALGDVATIPAQTQAAETLVAEVVATEHPKKEDESDEHDSSQTPPCTPLQRMADREFSGDHAEVTARRQSLPPMPVRSMCEVSMPMPPSSESWDWPLSRNEKKSRIAMLDHNELVTDRFELTEIARKLAEEVLELRENQEQTR